MYTTPETMAMASKVLNYIKKYPERHNQSSWVSVDGAEAPDAITEDNLCDTTMCIAGTAVFLSRPLEEFQKFDTWWHEEGRVLLGLNGCEADWLFYDASDEGAVAALEAIAKGGQDALDELVKGS